MVYTILVLALVIHTIMLVQLLIIIKEVSICDVNTCNNIFTSLQQQNTDLVATTSTNYAPSDSVSLNNTTSVTTTAALSKTKTTSHTSSKRASDNIPKYNPPSCHQECYLKVIFLQRQHGKLIMS